jgi:uncharacterized caspase-like protein
VNALHYAVIVGINQYPGFSQRPLKYARSDAEAFRDWLVSPEGGDVPDKNIRLITATADQERSFTSSAVAMPKLSDVNQALLAVAKGIRAHLNTQPDDRAKTRLYFYVAGHGIAPPGGEGALLMADAESEMLGDSLELSEYAKWFVECGDLREFVVFADCCREGLKGTPPASRPPFTRCEKTKGETVRIIGYATGLGDFAYEPAAAQAADSGRGYFTKALLEGLKGAARAQDGSVTAASLAAYVRRAVIEMTQTLEVPQRAQFPGDLAQPVVLCPAAGPRPKRRVSIRFPTGFGGRVVLRDGILNVVLQWDAANGALEVELDEGFYGVAPEGAADGIAFADRGLFPVIGGDRDVQL